ncbi:nitroreductase [Agrobacterium sp. MCAB5]|uniref:nitroreductase n=1 Tax=Agrobacterium sp. MCAB5 TaxID=3233042 RepID=UPI003F92FC0E
MSCDEGSPYKALISLAKARYSCRAFTSTPVPSRDIHKILEVARTAPSDCNTQPTKVFVVSGEPLDLLRAEMYRSALDGADRKSDVPPIGVYTGIFQERRRECGWALYNAVGVQKGDRVASAKQALENFRFFGAPHLAIITVHKDLAERGLFDAGIYLGHFLLAAQAVGVSAVPQGAIAHYAQIIRKHAAIENDFRIVCGVSFGYEVKDHAANSFRTTRAELSDSVIFVE